MKLVRFVIVAFVIFAFCYNFLKNQAFKAFKIYFPSEYLTLNLDEIEHYHDILEQKFIYLDKGSQFYVFESYDKKFVIKFLRFDKVKSPVWANFPGSISFQKNKKKQKIKRFIKQIKSIKLALNADLNFGVILNNLDGKFLNQKITLIEKNKNKQQIDLNQTIFLIQKKAVKLKDALKRVENKERELIVDKLFDAVQARLSLKIYNNTRKCMENIGLNNKKIIEYDIGDMSYLEDLEDSNMQKVHFRVFTDSMRFWLIKNMPELICYFDEKRKKYCDF
jgi:hypothetical protein